FSQPFDGEIGFAKSHPQPEADQRHCREQEHTHSTSANRLAETGTTSVERIRPLHGRGGVIERELTHGTEIDFSGAERRNRFDEMQVFSLREPQPGKLRLTEAFPQRRW